jgi:hypothetical protein
MPIEKEKLQFKSTCAILTKMRGLNFKRNMTFDKERYRQTLGAWDYLAKLSARSRGIYLVKFVSYFGATLKTNGLGI